MSKKQSFNFVLLASLALMSLMLLHCSAPIWERVDLNRRSGAPETAEKELLAYLNTHSGDAKAYFLLGETRAQLDNWQGMVDAFEECERLNIGWRTEIFARKNFYWRNNFQTGLDALRDEEMLYARSLFESCTIIFPTRARGFRLFAESSLLMGDTTSAINAFVYTLRVDDDDERARRFLMTTYFYTNQLREAINHADIILSKKKNDVEALRVKAYSYGLLKKRAEANQAYMALLDPRIPHLVEDYINFAGYKYSMGLYEDAAKILRDAIAHGGDKIENLEAIMQAHLMQQDYVDLFETAQELLAEDSTSIKALQLKQIALLAMRQHEKANNTELTYLITLSTLRLALKDYSEVIKNTNEVLKQDSLNIRAYELKIAALDSLGNKREARLNEMEMLHIKSDKFEKSKDHDNVISLNKRILEINPTDFEAMQKKSAAHKALGDSAAAAQTGIDYYLALANIHAGRKDYFDYLQDALSILLIDENHLVALKMKWEAYDSLGRPLDAVKSKFNYFQTLAEDEFARGQYEALINTTTQIIAMDSTNVRANNLKRDGYLALNRKNEAEQTQLRYFATIANILLQNERYHALLEKVDEILLIQPNNLHALQLRYTAFSRLQQTEEARESQLNYLTEKARINSREKNFQALLSTSDEILELDTTNLIALQFRYMALRDLSRKSEAIAAEKEYLHTLSQSYDRNQVWDKLLKSTTNLLKLDILDSVAVNLKAKSHSKLLQHNEARQTRLDYLEALTKQHMGAKRYDEAIFTTDKMLELQANYLPALEQRKKAFYSKGDWEIALKIEEQINQLTMKQ